MASLPEWPVLSAGEQTRLSWARRIETIEETPAYYHEYVAGLAAREGAFPYAVLTPSYAGFLVRTTEKLLCATAEAVHCLERVGEQPRATVFCLDAISYVEAGCILLNSWVKLSGQERDSGAYTSFRLKFNTVTDYLFTPIVERIRQCGVELSAGAGVALNANMSVERAKFDYLAQTHFKFMNAARRSLLTGEAVRQSLMQPEMQKKVLTLFGRSFYRMKAPAHIVILTDAELIVVADENLDSWGGEVKHGSIRTCIPLAKIKQASCRTEQEDLRLSVVLPGDETLEFTFDRAQQAMLDQLVAQIGQ